MVQFDEQTPIEWEDSLSQIDETFTDDVRADPDWQKTPLYRERKKTVSLPWSTVKSPNIQWNFFFQFKAIGFDDWKRDNVGAQSEARKKGSQTFKDALRL